MFVERLLPKIKWYHIIYAQSQIRLTVDGKFNSCQIKFMKIWYTLNERKFNQKMWILYFIQDFILNMCITPVKNLPSFFIARDRKFFEVWIISIEYLYWTISSVEHILYCNHLNKTIIFNTLKCGIKILPYVSSQFESILANVDTAGINQSHSHRYFSYPRRTSDQKGVQHWHFS